MASAAKTAEPSAEVSELAFCKMILHACKYPARPVIGVLLGSKPIKSEGAAGATDSKSSAAAAGGAKGISDAVPLFHNYPLAPMMEIAMTQVLCIRVVLCRCAFDLLS